MSIEYIKRTVMKGCVQDRQRVSSEKVCRKTKCYGFGVINR